MQASQKTPCRSRAFSLFLLISHYPKLILRQWLLVSCGLTYLRHSSFIQEKESTGAFHELLSLCLSSPCDRIDQ